MTDIPPDVMEAALEVVEGNNQWHIADSDTSGGWEDKTEEAAIAIARAILAERERCARVADELALAIDKEKATASNAAKAILRREASSVRMVGYGIRGRFE